MHAAPMAVRGGVAHVTPGSSAVVARAACARARLPSPSAPYLRSERTAALYQPVSGLVSASRASTKTGAIKDLEK